MILTHSLITPKWYFFTLFISVEWKPKHIMYIKVAGSSTLAIGILAGTLSLFPHENKDLWTIYSHIQANTFQGHW